MKVFFLPAVLVPLVLLAGCTVGPKYRTPTVATPEAYKETKDWKIATPQDVLNASFFLTAGEEVPVVVMRDNKKLTFAVQPMLRPDVPHELPYLNFSTLPLKMQP